MRTLLAGEGEDVCSGVDEGTTDSSGWIEGGDSAGAGEAIGAANHPNAAKGRRRHT